MQALAIAAGIAVLGLSVVLAWYKYKSGQLQGQLDTANVAVRTTAVQSDELRTQLESTLNVEAERHTKEQADDAAQASKVADAASAADLLNSIMRAHR